MKKAQHQLLLIETVTCRTPAFATGAKLQHHWPALLELIRESSPHFFELVRDLDMTTSGSMPNDKISYTIWKYFNRARFRATPFGSFGAVSWVAVGYSNQPLLDRQLRKYAFINWQEKEPTASDAPTIAKQSSMFVSNSTWYLINDTIRYLRHTGKEFELASVMIFPELQFLLNACQVPLSKAAIYKFMEQEFRLSPKSVRQLLVKLTEAQLLLNDRQPNITGPDYFQRIDTKKKTESPTYIIAERKCCSGSFDPSPLRHVGEYLNFMNDFLAGPGESTLDGFSNAFLRKFDQKAVPLAIALDPETGVGYGNLGSPVPEENVTDLLEKLQKAPRREQVYRQTEPHRFLLNSLVKGEAIIKLEKYQGKATGPSLPLPNTLSVLFHYSQGKPVIEQTGGCTANALLGRFTLAQPKAEEAGKAIVAMEEKANPGILFFDVAYQAEQEVDNINRRAALYAAELPILTWSCNPEPLNLSDILVAVRSREVILWSKKRKCRIVPRIASAYNYTRSDLALYRFLCDLQHQGLRSDLNFRWNDFFTGLDHYPRVTYRDLIVMPAMWKVPAAGSFDAAAWLKEQQINFPFSCGSGDQLLYFDPGQPADMAAFIKYREQQKDAELYISENHREQVDHISDGEGHLYAAQYIANYSHQQTIYIPHEMPMETELITNCRFPGSEWLYFELYCHPSRTNELLSGFIAPFLASHKTWIKKWFFIRYTEPAPHIRLRLKLNDQYDIGQLIPELHEGLRPLLNSGLVSDIQIKTYFRENERYGIRRIDLVENFFCADSRLALKILSSKTDLYRSTLNVLKLLCWEALPDERQRQEFTRKMADVFSREFGFTHEDYKKINNAYARLTANTAIFKPCKHYIGAFINVVKNCPDEGQREKMLADLLHMHINRIFDQEQRLHEAILYQYLRKLGLIKTAAPLPAL